MTKLPAPEQWVLSTMSEMETAEMIEKHIEHYVEDAKGNRYPVHYPTNFVRHYMKRDDNALPVVVAIATAPCGIFKCREAACKTGEAGVLRKFK